MFGDGVDLKRLSVGSLKVCIFFFEYGYAWWIGKLKMVKCRDFKGFFCFESGYVWWVGRLKLIKCRDFKGIFLVWMWLWFVS